MGSVRQSKGVRMVTLASSLAEIIQRTPYKSQRKALRPCQKLNPRQVEELRPLPVLGIQGFVVKMRPCLCSCRFLAVSFASSTTRDLNPLLRAMLSAEATPCLSRDCNSVAVLPPPPCRRFVTDPCESFCFVPWRLSAGISSQKNLLNSNPARYYRER